MNFEKWFSLKVPQINWPGAQGVLKLAETGATVPFIARYRKEQTNNLDEVTRIRAGHASRNRPIWAPNARSGIETRIRGAWVAR